QNVERDDAVVVAGDALRHEIEGERRRLIRAAVERQAEPQQRVCQALLRLLDLPPGLDAARLGQVRYGAVAGAGLAERRGIAFCHKQVARRMVALLATANLDYGMLGAARPDLAEYVGTGRRRLERDHGQRVGIKAETMPTGEAGVILEVDARGAGRAGKN